MLDENSFAGALNEGFHNDELRKLIIWLANEISALAKMEEKLTTDSDLSNFLIELSGFLKELKCSYEMFLNDSNINNRLQTAESRFLLVEYLISELMTTKMLLVLQKPREKGTVITIVR